MVGDIGILQTDVRASFVSSLTPSQTKALVNKLKPPPPKEEKKE